MECSICVVRSSVGYCSECQALLCEECGIKCDECGKMVCPEHKHETRSGRTICLACDRERKKRRAARGGAATPAPSSDEKAKGGTALEDLEEDAEEEVLTASARVGIPSWQLSLYTALAGLFLLLVFRFVLGQTYIGPVHISLFMLILPILALVWAGIGLTREFDPRSFIGIGVAVLTCLVAVVVFVQDPARALAQQEEQEVQQRQQMTPEERREEVEQILQRFQPSD